MRGWLIVAMLSAALLATPVWAQRGVARAGGAAPRSMRVGHAGGFSTLGGAVRRPFFFNNYGFRFPRNRRYFGAYGAYGAYGWPYYYGDYYPGYLWWDNDNYDQGNTGYQQQNYALQQEVNDLDNEVGMLQQQQADQQAEVTSPPPPPQAKTPPTPSTPTTFVFRNGSTQEVQNYAIAGHTLWLLSEQRARKIPLSELDIPATQKANEARGVTLQMPATD